MLLTFAVTAGCIDDLHFCFSEMQKSGFFCVFFPGRDQCYSFFSWARPLLKDVLFFVVYYPPSTRRLNQEVDFCCCFLEKPGIEPATPGLQGE